MAKNREIEVREASDLVGREWYDSLIEEVGSILTETEFDVRWKLIEAYHAVGSRIASEIKNFEKENIYGEEIVKLVAKSLGKSDRTIYYAIEFAEKFKKPEDLPGGKDMSWSKVCKFVLQDKDLPDKCRHKRTRMVKVCDDCGRRV